MTALVAVREQGLPAAWHPPVDRAAYDRAPTLSPDERAALAEVVARRARPPAFKRWPLRLRRALARLLRPLEDVLAHTAAAKTQRSIVTGVFLDAMHRAQRAFWGWTREDWQAALGACKHTSRQHLLAVSYLLGDSPDLYLASPGFLAHPFARKIFGAAAVDAVVERVRQEVRGWGYRDKGTVVTLHVAVAALLLASRSPRLEDVTTDAVATVGRPGIGRNLRQALAVAARALVALGCLPAHPPPDPAVEGAAEAAAEGVAAEWLAWSRRWHARSTLAPKTRKGHYYNLLIAGRWLGHCRPDLADPQEWTYDTASAFVAAVDQMVVGRWSHPLAHAQGTGRAGQPLAPNTKDGLLRSLSAFFHDCQEWGWLRRRFDPRRGFRAPPSIRASIGPRPRVIAQDVWGKLLWAGLNLTEVDLPGDPAWPGAFVAYPLALVQALAVTWLFAGLRADELRRLPVGCVRWQHEDVTIPGTTEVLPKDAVCWLDVPVNKTSPAFTKPVDRPVGEAIAAWEARRPAQAPFRDRKTGQPTHHLFAYRGKQLGMNYLNRVLIPALCRKAGVPPSDARGPITSHRARSTIASMLFNARDPLSLLELKQWLGHKYLSSTQHYVEITPLRQAQALRDADYFGRALRMVDVLVDKAAVTSGAAADGAPWLYYDLGHGYCTHPYFSQCPHRLVCAKCAFYRPKAEMAAFFARAKDHLTRLREELPLTEEEQAVVAEDVAGYEHLLAQLAAVPTPDGRTPHQIQGQVAGCGGEQARGD